VSKGMTMLRITALIVLAAVGLCGPAPAGVLSSTDVQRLHDYEQFVIPADREMPVLRDMAARVDKLIAMAEGSGEAVDGGSRSDFRFAMRDLPRIGGRTLETMVASLQAIDNPEAFAPPEWAALLGEVRAEIEERLAYDTELLKAYQRSVAAGAPGFGQSVTLWEERPNAASHWSRFQSILDRAP
jgi:hypothetical protein